MAAEREKQLAYSELQTEMLDEPGRRRKATKIIRVLEHFLGREALDGLTVADVGCSTGFIADELHRAGARTVGFDIDVPGLARASARFGGQVSFACADGQRLPVADETFDVVVFNHIYEHVVDPDAVIAELHRVLKPHGVLYLGLVNKFGILEPHYKLPFLSYLPQRLADRYVRAFHRADEFYEDFRSRRGLADMTRDFYLWDYTYTVLGNPDRFAADDMLPGALRRVPPQLFKAVQSIMPTYLWVGAKAPLAPQGDRLRPAPLPVAR